LPVMHLRPFRHRDLDTLYEIDQACFPPGISYGRTELAGFIAGRGSRTWIAEEGGQIVGFLIADRAGKRAAHIVTVDVRAAYRRRGAGRVLMEAAEEWARDQKLELIYLETAEDNLVAQRFYQARGYARVDRVERYYVNGQAAWVMAKSLKGRD
jgi:ribosomal-protein-alanine N-acetyltransferase